MRDHTPNPRPAEATLPFVLGGRLARRLPRPLDAACYALIAAVIALPLRGLYAATGSTMEEGFMLVFPERLVAGDVPNVDFLHLYGPGSLYTLAGWYAVFGHTLASERTFGLLQHIAVIAGIYALTRIWGRAMATAAAIVCTLVVLTPIGLSALAWEGAIALGLWSVIFAIRSERLAAQSVRRSRVNAVVAAVLAGLALTFRPDLIVALGLAHGWMLWRRRGQALLRPFALGLLAGLVPMFVHLAMAGIPKSIQGMVLDPVFNLRPGRELPRPPQWSVVNGALQAISEGVPARWPLPAPSASQQLFLWFFAMLIVAIGTPIVAWWLLLRRPPADATSPDTEPDAVTRRDRGVALTAAGLFGAGLIQQGLQRPDSTHLAWVVCICFSLAPVTAWEIIRRVQPRLAGRGRDTVSIALVATMLLVVCPFFTYRHYLLHTRVTLGDLPPPFQIARDDRQFWVGDYWVGVAGREVVADLEAWSEPGERLLVGPADLARTIYSDVMFYYFFPELTPATYYIEMDPGLADAEGSRLAADVASSDWVLLTNFWTGWNEPNASSERGSDAANQVVANDFCLVGEYPREPHRDYPSTASLVLLYHRCAQGDGISPADTGVITARERAAGYIDPRVD